MFVSLRSCQEGCEAARVLAVLPGGVVVEADHGGVHLGGRGQTDLHYPGIGLARYQVGDHDLQMQVSSNAHSDTYCFSDHLLLL